MFYSVLKNPDSLKRIRYGQWNKQKEKGLREKNIAVGFKKLWHSELEQSIVGTPLYMATGWIIHSMKAKERIGWDLAIKPTRWGC